MRIRSILKVVGGSALALGLLGIVVGGFAWIAFKQYRLEVTTIEENLSGTVTDITTAASHRQAISALQLSEEMVAQAARNYAATEEDHWHTQYTQAHQEFESTLSELQTAAPSAELDRVMTSAQRLAVISGGAIELVESGRALDATEALNGSQYVAERTALENHIHTYSLSYADQVNQTLARYQDGITQTSATTKEIIYTSVVLTGFTLLTGLVLTGIFVQLRLKSWQRFAQGVKDAAASNFKNRIGPSPDASVRPVTNNINMLADRLATTTSESAAVFETTHEALLVIDDDGVVQSANAAALDIFELPQERLVGRSFDELQAIWQPNSPKIA